MSLWSDLWFSCGPERVQGHLKRASQDLNSGHVKRASQNLNSEPLTHIAFDWLLEPVLISPNWQHTVKVWPMSPGSCLPPSWHPAWICTWQVPYQQGFNRRR